MWPKLKHSSAGWSSGGLWAEVLAKCDLIPSLTANNDTRALLARAQLFAVFDEIRIRKTVLSLHILTE